ncbi:MFS transporter [Paracoccus indicus]|uniref:MFS transporter n=1 Tax=Paracoccus indicus TaxID=2079229 RepID=UPI000D35B319|nr:MFS transporter [Paracoccus indicus]
MSHLRTAPHLLTLVVLSGVSALSMNVFLPSLPGMARDFEVDYSVMQLSVSAYIGASAVLQLLGGPISDRFGRRPVVLWSLVLFLLATIGTMGLGNGMVLPNANAGMMSIRPELAGTASGLGGALAVAGGAALSALAGALLQPGSGATPLLTIMCCSALGSLLAIAWVFHRERRIMVPA